MISSVLANRLPLSPNVVEEICGENGLVFDFLPSLIFDHFRRPFLRAFVPILIAANIERIKPS